MKIDEWNGLWCWLRLKPQSSPEVPMASWAAGREKREKGLKGLFGSWLRSLRGVGVVERALKCIAIIMIGALCCASSNFCQFFA